MSLGDELRGQVRRALLTTDDLQGKTIVLMAAVRQLIDEVTVFAPESNAEIVIMLVHGMARDLEIFYEKQIGVENNLSQYLRSVSSDE